MRFRPNRGVYFMVTRVGEIRRVKVGYARDVSRRHAALQTGCPATLRILGVIPVAQRLESEVHRRLAEHRVPNRREWYHCNAEVLRFIRANEVKYATWRGAERATKRAGLRFSCRLR